MFNTRIFSLCILPDENSVDIIIWGLEALNRRARTNVGEQVESSSKGQVQRDVTFANYRNNATCSTHFPKSPQGDTYLE